MVSRRDGFGMTALSMGDCIRFCIMRRVDLLVTRGVGFVGSRFENSRQGFIFKGVDSRQYESGAVGQI